MTSEKSLPTECSYCNEQFSPPPTGRVYDLHLEEWHDDYWANALSPEEYPGDYGKMDAVHEDCYEEMQVERRREENQSLQYYE